MLAVHGRSGPNPSYLARGGDGAGRRTYNANHLNLPQSMLNNMLPEQLVDFARYPLHALDTPAGVAVVERCRQDLEQRAFALLPGFLRPDALRAVAGEANRLVSAAHPQDFVRTPYSWRDNRGFDTPHPRAAMFRERNRVVTTELLPATALLCSLYLWDGLTEFVRMALGLESLYRSADPHLSLSYNVLSEGDEVAWHFDSNEFIVSLMLQQADAGGEFECAPYVRSEEDDNYDEVARVFAGNSERTVRPPLAPGALMIFVGRHTAHRVVPVESTRQARLMALLVYERRSGVLFPRATVRAVTEPDSGPLSGTTQASPGTRRTA